MERPPNGTAARPALRLSSRLVLAQRLRRAVALADGDGGAEITALESLAFRRERRPRPVRETREMERLDRTRQSDAEALRRRGREEFLARLVAHSDEFKAFHRDARRAGGRLSKAVIADFDSKAKRESKERDRAQRERLRALRENNIDEYMKLVTETKNERLTQLLEETDGYLRELGAKIEEQKRELIAAHQVGNLSIALSKDYQLYQMVCEESR